MSIMHVNVLKFIFAFLAFSVLIFSFLINYLEPFLHTVIVNSFKYGKLTYNNYQSGQIEVPKKWFRHFYVVAIICSTFVLMLEINSYIYSVPVPPWVIYYLDLVGSSERQVTVNATNSFIALILFNMQTWKRFYETYFISIFSDSYIKISHYIIGFVHYIGATSILIVEAPYFAPMSLEHRNVLTLADVSWHTVVGITIFLWAWYNQFRSAVILANLRKDENGNVVSHEHKIPTGGLFEQISSPHLFCEMLIYLGLYVTLWGNTSWPYVFIWVLVNQFEVALLVHWWYKDKFKAYPKSRRAFIPYVL